MVGRNPFGCRGHTNGLCGQDEPARGPAARRARAGVAAVGLLGMLGILATAPVLASSAEPVPAGTELQLTLDDAVARALVGNPDLVGARLGRVLQQYDRDRAEEWFAPRLGFGALTIRRTTAAGERAWDLAAGPRVDLRLPSGGAVSLSPRWTATIGRDEADWRDRAGVSVALRQPLLRGGGFTIGRAPVQLARLGEEANVLRFQGVLMDVVVAVTRAYRRLIEAELAVGINRRSLERAEQTLAVNRMLVDTGRMARQDMTQTEADIASRELGVIESEIRVDDARRDLNALLDLDGTVRVIPTEHLSAEPVSVNLERSRAEARAHAPAYRRAILAERRAEIDLALARNGLLWDVVLDANASLAEGGRSAAGNSGGDVAVGLSLSIPLGGDGARQRRRELLRAELALRTARTALASATRELDSAVGNAVRVVETRWRRLDLAQSALGLAETKLETEREKLALGLSSNFRLAAYETDLLDAQVGELRARIDYLDAVIVHELTVGTLLVNRGIAIDRLPGVAK